MQAEARELIIVGTGFSGLALAIQQKKAGFHDFILLEQAAEVGGTWRENRYPGAACDVPSPVYSFSFEPNPNWSRLFSPQEEILNYLKHCTEKYQLRPHIRFHSQVMRANFAEDPGQWTLQLKEGSVLHCRYFIVATGGLSRPAYPKIPGIQDYQGALFHTAQWRADVPLESAHIAVIGTGASAIQLVPKLAEKAAKVSLFQRTPAWILPKKDRPLRSRWPFLLKGLRRFLYWQYECRAVALLHPQLMGLGSRLARNFLLKEVPDPQLRAKLQPNYIMGCKRVLLSNDFYSTLNRPHVELVTDPIEKITARGIKTRSGTEHIFDAIICATGFQVAEASAPFPIFGRKGLNLSDYWQDGAQAYLGTTVAGFPNLFFMVGPNAGLGHNSIIFIIESQVRYIIEALRLARKKQFHCIEVKASVQDLYNEWLQKKFQDTVWTRDNCVSWYQTPSGRNTTIWPGFSFVFRLKTRHFDASSYQMN